MHQHFSNLQFIPGVGYVQGTTSQRTASHLGDESAVMMISGLGAMPRDSNAPPEGVSVSTDGLQPGTIGRSYQQSYSGASTPPAGPLQQPITLFNVTLPLWAWLSIAAVLGGAGGYFLRGRLR